MMDIDAVVQELRAQTGWLRLLGIAVLVPLLKQQLGTDAERLAFELTDGRHTTREIAREVGKDHSTVGRWWSRWAASGAVTVDATGRARHLTSLTSLGIATGPAQAMTERRNDQGAEE